MKKSTVTVFPMENEAFDIIAPDSSGIVHVLAFKEPLEECSILKDPLRIGSTEFLPGVSYTSFGKREHTSAVCLL